MLEDLLPHGNFWGVNCFRSLSVSNLLLGGKNPYQTGSVENFRKKKNKHIAIPWLQTIGQANKTTITPATIKFF